MEGLKPKPAKAVLMTDSFDAQQTMHVVMYLASSVHDVLEGCQTCVAGTTTSLPVFNVCQTWVALSSPAVAGRQVM